MSLFPFERFTALASFSEERLRTRSITGPSRLSPATGDVPAMPLDVLNAQECKHRYPRIMDFSSQEDHIKSVLEGSIIELVSRYTSERKIDYRFMSRSSTPKISTGVPVHDLSTKSWEANNKLFNKR